MVEVCWGDCGFGVWWKCVGVIVALVCGGSVLGVIVALVCGGSVLG